jgi:rubrerythrin
MQSVAIKSTTQTTDLANISRKRKENNMELISREDAIKCLDGNVLITEQKEAEAVKEYFEMVIARLKALPTVEERKEGHWIKHFDEAFPGDSTIECSVCHEEQYTTIDDYFCPNCGAGMKGE